MGSQNKHMKKIKEKGGIAPKTWEEKMPFFVIRYIYLEFFPAKNSSIGNSIPQRLLWAISHHPDNKEILHSNVLYLDMLGKRKNARKHVFQE